MKLLPLLLILLACGDATSPSTNRTCLTEVNYRYVYSGGEITTGGSVAPSGGPLCIELTADFAIVTSGTDVWVSVTGPTGVGIWYLWPGGERAEAQVFRKDGRLYLAVLSGNLRWLVASGMVITEGPHGRLSLHFEDNDEVLTAEFLP